MNTMKTIRISLCHMMFLSIAVGLTACTAQPVDTQGDESAPATSEQSSATSIEATSPNIIPGSCRDDGFMCVSSVLFCTAKGGIIVDNPCANPSNFCCAL